MNFTDKSWRWFHRVNCTLIILRLLLEQPLTVRADPSGGFLATFLISLAISAAATAAQIGISYLLTPKPKPVDKDKLSGDVKITAIGEDVPIPEIYGGRFADGLGGFEHGGIIVWASQIRKVVISIPGGGGGKGAPRAAPQQEHHYYQDYAVLVGRGPLNVLKIKANTDVIYDQTGGGIIPRGTTYEAESATLSGGATTASDGSCSNGAKVTGVGSGGTGQILFDNIQVNTADYYELVICYKCPAAQDYQITVNLNGVDLPLMTLPYPGSTSVVATVTEIVSMLPGVDNDIILKHTSASADIDRIIIAETIIIIEPPPDPSPLPIPNTTAVPYERFAISGVFNPTYSNPTPTYDNVELVDPLIADERPLTEWNYHQKADADGIYDLTLPSQTIRVYPGTSTQLPDPLLQTYFNTKYGANATPAYRNRCYVVIENMEITKYSGIMPNFVFTTEHQTIRTLEDLFTFRVKEAGLEDAEIDFTALGDSYIRGLGIMQKQAPKVEMELLSRVFDIDVFQDIDGKIKGVIPSETINATIPIDELNVKENFDFKKQSQEVANPVQTIVKDEYQLPKTFSVGFFNASNAFEVASVNAQREYTASDRHDTYDTQLTMTNAEAQRFADRELQKLYAEKNALSIETFHKWAEVTPTLLIEVEELDGSFSPMRVKAVDGWIPGTLKISGVSRNLPSPSQRLDLVDPLLSKKIILIQPPGYVIGTVIDIAIMRSSEYSTGFYVAACNTNQRYQWRGAVLLVEKEGGYEKLTEIPNQAIIGRTLDSISGQLETVGAEYNYGTTGQQWIEPAAPSTVTVDLFWGELNSATTAELDDRANMAIIGNELIQYATVTKIDGYPNRWTLSVVRRSGQGTDNVHAQSERFVFLNNAVKYVPIDYSEVGQGRNYKFVGGGQVASNVWSTAFTYYGQSTQTSSRSIAVNTNYSVKLSDGVIKVDASGGARTITLPVPDFALNHEPWTIKKVDGSANAVIITPADGTIEGAASYSLLLQYDSVDIFSKDGSYWIK